MNSGALNGLIKLQQQLLYFRNITLHAAYPLANDGHSEVGPSQVNSQSTLCLQDVIDVLGDGIFHRGEAERLLEGLIQVNGT